VSNPLTSGLVAIALLVVLAGCGKPATPAVAAKPAEPSAAASEAHPQPAAAFTAVDFSGLKKADGGLTIAELYAGKGQLSGKPVLVRGKVVKTRANIMGKNWVHVRDGTGGSTSSDLTVITTDAPPVVGSTVLVSGALSTDRDLGLGYRYEILIEDGKIKVE